MTRYNKGNKTDFTLINLNLTIVDVAVYFEEDEVSNGDTIYVPEGTTDLRFECKPDPKSILDNFEVSQEWILDHELNTKQYFSDEKSAYILEVARTKHTKITCSVEVSSEEFWQTVTLTTTFSVIAGDWYIYIQ